MGKDVEVVGKLGAGLIVGCAEFITAPELGGRGGTIVAEVVVQSAEIEAECTAPDPSAQL